MKHKRSIGRVILAVLGLAALLMGGLSLLRAASTPISTSVVTRSVEEETVSLSGYVAREELVLDNPSGILTLLLNEGEKVGVDQTIAIRYSSDDALELQQELEALRVKEQQLQYAESVALGAASALRLDSEILQQLLTLRSKLSTVGLGGETESVIASLRTMVMQRDYSAEGEDPTEELNAVRSEIAALEKRLARSAQTITAPVAGIYSAAVDGYEAVLTPESIRTLAPSQLSLLQPTDDHSSLGKLISSATWYFTVAMESSAADGLKVGRSALLRFSGSVTEKLSCRVEAIGEEESGRRTVVFSCSSHLADMTQARKVDAELIRDSWSGLKVPKKALRVDENGQAGVYCLVGLTARFKPVRVIYTGADDCLVEPDEPRSETLRIREGDEVIISARELYDGKTVG